MGRDDSSPAIHRPESEPPRFLVPSGTTDRLTLAITFSAVPLGLNVLYWSRILYPAINHRAFHSSFPKVQLRFVTCAHEGLEKDLRKGVTDLAFLLAESIQAADLTAEVLRFESVVLVAGRDHPLAAKSEVLTRDLAGETFLFSTSDCSYRRTFEQILDQHGVQRDNSLQFSSVEALKQSVSAGVGITVLPEIAIKAERTPGKLTTLPWSEGKMEVALLMIWYKEKWLSPTLKAFMETTRNIVAPFAE